MEIGEIIELLTGIIGTTKRKEDGSLDIDKNKLAIFAATFAGQQFISRWQKNRDRKSLLKAEKLGLSDRDLKKLQKKRSNFGRNLIVGTAISLAVYLLVMKPEQRTELFKNIDNAINEVSSLINEIQGKPAEDLPSGNAN